VEDPEPVGPLAELRRLLHGLLDSSQDDEHAAVMLELLRHGHAEDVVEPFSRYTAIWHGYLVDLLQRAVAAGEVRADLEADAVAGLIIEVSLGLQPRAPLPEGCEAGQSSSCSPSSHQPPEIALPRVVVLIVALVIRTRIRRRSPAGLASRPSGVAGAESSRMMAACRPLLAHLHPVAVGRF